MTDKESSGGAQRAKEDDFFHKRERELIEGMRSRAEAGAALRQLAGATGIADDALLRDLLEHGFRPDTASLLELAPLVMVAWSDGSITPQERSEILLVARLQGVAEGGPAWGQLAGWVEASPPDEFFRLTLRSIRAAWQSLPVDERESRERALVERCARVARVSGRFLRLTSGVSAGERRAIRRVAEELGCTRETVQRIEEEK